MARSACRLGCPGFSAWLGGRAAATRKAYVSDVTAFAEWMSRSNVDGPEGVDRLSLRRYLASLGTRRLARATIARKAAALRCYFAWLCRQGRIDSDPARSLRAPTGGGRLPRVLSNGEVTALLDVGAADALDRRDLAVLELLYAAGLRVSELCGLDRGDIDLGARTVTVLGKGGKQRRMPIHDEAVTVLTAWLRDGRDEMDGPAEAAFVNQRGNRLGPRDVRRILDRRAASPTHPARLASHLCHPPARRRRRPPRGPRTPRPRQPGHHAGVHAREQGAIALGLRPDPSPGLGPGRAANLVRPTKAVGSSI